MLEYVYLLRTEWEYIGWMWSCSYNITVGHVAIKSGVQLFIKNATDELLLTVEGKAIARPVLRIYACGTDFQEILNESIFLPVSSLSHWYLCKSSYYTAEKCGKNQQQ